jgi:hypothetical protein
MSATEQVADQAVVDGTYLLTASAETRKALAPPGEPYTAFTGELIHTLAEGVPGGPALLDMETVYRRLHVRLTARSRPVPQQRNRNAGGAIALVRNAAGPAEPEPSPPPVVRPSRHPLEDVHEGAAQLASQIARTLGPAGGLVRYTAPDGTRRTTSDPALLCQAAAEPRTDAELGADLIRRLVRRTRAEYSDGAATAAVMAQAMITTALDIVRKDAMPPARLRTELAESGERAVRLLRGRAVEIAWRGQLRQVLTAATGDPDGAGALTEAADKIGKEGVIFLEERRRPGLDLELHEGMFLPAAGSPAAGSPAAGSPADPGDHDPPPAFTLAEPYLLVLTEPPSAGLRQFLDRQDRPAVVLGPADDGAVLMRSFGEHRWERRLPSAHPFGTLDDLALLIGANLQQGNPVVVPKIEIDASGVRIDHGYRGDSDRIQRRVNELRAAAAAAPTAAQRAGIKLRMAQIAGGVATIRMGRTPGEPEDVFLPRLEVLARARDAMPALIDQGFVAGGGVALRDVATGLFRRVPVLPMAGATAVLVAGLSEPFIRFAADCGLTPQDAHDLVAAASPANGLDVPTGRPVEMAEAGIIDSAAVLAGAITAAVATTREFLALA